MVNKAPGQPSKAKGLKSLQAHMRAHKRSQRNIWTPFTHNARLGIVDTDDRPSSVVRGPTERKCTWIRPLHHRQRCDQHVASGQAQVHLDPPSASQSQAQAKKSTGLKCTWICPMQHRQTCVQRVLHQRACA